MDKDKKKWIQEELPNVKKMVEELRKPDKNNDIKQYQVKDENNKQIKEI